MSKNVFNELQNRGLVAQSSSEGLEKRLETPISLYCGFDPTGDSLHIGHLLPIIMLKHFQNYGHDVIVLVGGSTGLIGDPRMSGERILNDKETVNKFSGLIKEQLSKFLLGSKTQYVNNYEWTTPISIIDFLRDYGKFFNVNYMLNKETVKSRLDTGISFTEFTYTILQALDFERLYTQKKCQLQLGGNDQWGNLTSGLDLIRKMHPESEVYAMTNPLVTKADGTKFGKTEGGAIWLNPLKTTPYEFYQFFFNAADADVIKYLRYFTFLDQNIIDELEVCVIQEPHLRKAQKTLAKELTIFVHGETAYEQVMKITEALFSGDLSTLTVQEIDDNFKFMELYEVEEDTLLVDVLITANLASSKREAREFISNNAVSINGNKVSGLEDVLTKDIAIGGKYTLIKRGKKKYSLIKIK